MDVDKKIQTNYGLWLVIILSVIPMFAWKFGYDFVGLSVGEAAALSLAKIGAFGGLAMFALSLILSGRYLLTDKLFGGLDRMYIAHRFLGTFSIALLFLHPVAFSLFRLQQNAGLEAVSIWYNPTDIGVFLGALGLYLLVGFGLWSIFAKVKYETFVKVHRLLGSVFVLGAAHAFAAGSVLSSNVFMFVYMLVLCGFAVFTYVTYSLLGDLLHSHFKYEVMSVKDAGNNITEIYLKPKGRIINFQPGQFLYVSFNGLEDHGYHPFSIASSSRQAVLRLVVRRSGDFTNALAQLMPGQKATIRGAHGGFRLAPKKDVKQIWIAGGIGVTPFLSGALSLRPQAESEAIDMVYACDDDNPYGENELSIVAERFDFFSATVHSSVTSGFLTLAALQEKYPDLPERDIYICGPPVMLNSFVKEATAGGFESKLHYEEFSY